MSNLPLTSLGRYQYTALDKLSVCTLGAQPGSQRFYLGERLSTEIKGAVQHSVMQNGEQLLAQQQRQASTLHTQLLATDQQRSVLTLLDASRPQHLAYSPYGHRTPENGLLSLLGFNGERPDPLTGWYLLGNGYRAFNPVLMRFNSPDSWSPFGEGGLNAYGYCAGDPVNRTDPTGHKFGNPIKGILNIFGRKKGIARAASGANDTTLGLPVTSVPTSATTVSTATQPATHLTAATPNRFETYSGQSAPPPSYKTATLPPPSYESAALKELLTEKLDTMVIRIQNSTNLDKLETLLNQFNYLERVEKNLNRTPSKRSIKINPEQLTKILRTLT